MAYTPGPWKACGEDLGQLCTCRQVWSESADFVVAVAISAKDENYTGGQGITDEEELQANTRLIAAAPDLLAACKAVNAHLVSTFPPYREGESPYDVVRAAIAKAEGGTQ